MEIVQLNIRELVRFYDDEPDARTHSNAVKTVAGEELGLAVFEEFLSEQHRAPRRIPGPCTTKGAWLDGWIRVEQPEQTLYQIEVKSWSMHGYGSIKHRLSVDASSSELATYKKQTWDHYWQAGTFKAKGLKKVLKRMTLPKDEPGPAEPVACIWAAVHPDGLQEPFFSVKASEGDFRSVHVFSVSAYLRKLLSAGTTTLKIKLPNTARRMQYLSSLFPPDVHEA